MSKRLKIFLIYLSLFSYLGLSNIATYTSLLDNSFSQEVLDNEQVDQSQDDDHTAILTDLTLEAVVYSPSIPLNQTLLLAYKLTGPILVIAYPVVDTPRPLISYLINTFCRTIAINAP